MKQAKSTLRKRLGLYLLLAVLLVACPLLSVHLTGEVFGLFAGFLLTQFAFGLIFIRKPIAPRHIWIFLGTLLSFGLSWAGGKLGERTMGLDKFGYWELVLTSLLASVLVWEIVHQVSSRLSNKA